MVDMLSNVTNCLACNMNNVMRKDLAKIGKSKQKGRANFIVDWIKWKLKWKV
jgi:hypothetical protein